MSECLVIPHEQQQELIAHCQCGLPNEAGGLLAGVVTEAGRMVHKVYCLTNVDHSPEHFSLAPEEQFAAMRNMRSNGWALLANFHSHPVTPARPSAEDNRLAFDPSIYYVIVSLSDRNHPEVRAFARHNGVLHQTELIFTGGGNT